MRRCGCCKRDVENEIANIIASVALEEAGIAHILNAEGEKIQKIIAVSDDPEEIIAVNNAVAEIIENLAEVEKSLAEKLKAALEYYYKCGECHERINPLCQCQQSV